MHMVGYELNKCLCCLAAFCYGKAMIIHGANAMGGSSDPDGERGFGRVHLEAAMPFDGEDLWALYVEDDDGSTSGKGQVGMGCLISFEISSKHKVSCAYSC